MTHSVITVKMDLLLSVRLCLIALVFVQSVCANYDGAVRLVGGSNSSHEGRVEIYINGSWGTVCDDAWDNVDAGVVCRQLGIEGIAIARTDAYFGAGTGNINMDEVGCSGNENFLINCSYTSRHDCDHSEDAGVTCIAPQCNETEIRLVGGSNDMEGRVEVCINGQWGTVCDDLWGTPDATVVCRQLGFNGSAIARTNAYFGAGTGNIHMDEVGCSGNENFLINCSYTSQHDCDHSEDAGVTCAVTPQCNDSDIRLVGGSNDMEGRVEVCVDRVWGTVCDDLWGTPDATVVCRQLGFSGSAIARTNAYFGAGTGNIHMDDVECSGNENYLINCTFTSQHNCVHSEDAGVTCVIASPSLTSLTSITTTIPVSVTPTPSNIPGSCVQVDDDDESVSYGSSLYLHICCQSSNLGQTFCFERSECKRTISCPLIQPESCP